MRFQADLGVLLSFFKNLIKQLLVGMRRLRKPALLPISDNFYLEFWKLSCSEIFLEFYAGIRDFLISSSQETDFIFINFSRWETVIWTVFGE